MFVPIFSNLIYINYVLFEIKWIEIEGGNIGHFQGIQICSTANIGGMYKIYFYLGTKVGVSMV